ncbi:retrovirus-related pol polyprotein from transposon TNT 1-94 [Tanacetum coccineum]
MNVSQRRQLLNAGNVGNIGIVGNVGNAGNACNARNTGYNVGRVVNSGGNNVRVRNVGNYGKEVEDTRPKCYNCMGTGHYPRDCKAKKRVRDSKYLKDQMLLAKKEEAGIRANEEEYEFLAEASDEEDRDKEFDAPGILMAMLSEVVSDTDGDNGPTYDTDVAADVTQIFLWYIDNGCSKHMTCNLKLLINFVEKFLGTVYYVERLDHNLLSVEQFCDADLEVAFRKDTCFILDLEGVDLLKSSRQTHLYSIALSEITSSFPICLSQKHRPLKLGYGIASFYLNFGNINKLARNNIVK